MKSLYTDGGTGSMVSRVYEANIPVLSDNEVQLFAEMCGTDVGQNEFLQSKRNLSDLNLFLLVHGIRYWLYRGV